MKEKKAYLRVDLDWGSTGIWVLDEPFQKYAGGNLSDYKSLNLPYWLIERFNLWTDWYNSWEPWNKDGDSQNEPEDELFDAYGLSLAIDLKQFLGDEYHVEYMKNEILNAPYPVTRKYAKVRYTKDAK